jgi:hypothetical protein
LVPLVKKEKFGESEEETTGFKLEDEDADDEM